MDDPEWDKHFKDISDDDWKILIEKAVKYWENLTDFIKDEQNTLETDTCPMHPYNFFNLVTVNGFNKVNGYTYQEYVSKWRNRMDLIESGQPHFFG